MRRLAGVGAAVLAALVVTSGSAAREVAVDLELVLAIDVSRSIDDTEARLQRQGYVSAFRDPEVIRAIGSGVLGRIAVAFVEWAGPFHTERVAGWTLIDGAAKAHAFAALLSRDTPSRERWTSISAAIDHAVPWFDANGFEGTRRVIDVSGDGPNNIGGLVALARDRAVAAGITINGLPILDRSGGPYSRFNIPDLDLYYRDCVIGGPGAFFVAAENFADFARAIRRKLILEIAGLVPNRPAILVPAQAAGAARASPPCDIGERLLRERGEF